MNNPSHFMAYVELNYFYSRGRFFFTKSKKIYIVFNEHNKYTQQSRTKISEIASQTRGGSEGGDVAIVVPRLFFLSPNASPAGPIGGKTSLTIYIYIYDTTSPPLKYASGPPLFRTRS